MCQWKWLVREFYNETVKFPKIPGELAIETCHTSDDSRDVEVRVAEKRGDVYTLVLAYPHSGCLQSLPRRMTARDFELIRDLAQLWQEIHTPAQEGTPDFP